MLYIRVVVDTDEKEASSSVSVALERAGYAVTDQADADVTVRVDLNDDIDIDLSSRRLRSTRTRTRCDPLRRAEFIVVADKLELTAEAGRLMLDAPIKHEIDPKFHAATRHGARQPSTDTEPRTKIPAGPVRL